MRDDTLIVLRQSGERTRFASRESALMQVPEAQVVTVSEAPFTRTLRRAYEVGLERGFRWTLCLDADDILRLGGLDTLVQAAEQYDDTLFVLQGLCWDKFFGGPKSTPPYLYRTKHLEVAIPLIPGDDEVKRPESNTNGQMAAKGYLREQIDAVIGLHGHEQFYRDVFRVCFSHAIKHSRYMAALQPMWKRNAREDPDFLIALWGAQTGDLFKTGVALDRRTFAQLHEVLPMFGMAEKEDGPFPFDVEAVGEMLDKHTPPPEYYEFLQILDNVGQPPGVLHHVGSFVQKLGNRIQGLAK
ncbi:MAG: hypothetical protein ACFB51_16235 [Anaerolineae bacterium]